MSIFESMTTVLFALLLAASFAGIALLFRAFDRVRRELQTSAAEAARLRTERDAAREEIVRMREGEAERNGHLRAELELLSNRIFDEKAGKFKEMGTSAISDLVTPVRENLDRLQKALTESERNDAVREQSLMEALERVAQINGRLGDQADHLAKALRGDNKLIGDFGEILLEQLLEFSGLRNGVHFVEQGIDLGLQDASGRHLKPDVVVFLPENRCLVVDSKTSLASWTDAQSDDPAKRSAALESLAKSIRSHVSDLASKPYTESLATSGKVTVDFKFLFVPIESAFQACLATDPRIYADAFAQRVILTSPTTLLAVLATVTHTWKQWELGRNAQRIGERANLLLDKLHDFLASMEQVGTQLDKARTSFDEARMRLSQGRGNLVGQAQKLRELGARSDKLLPKSLEATAEFEDDREPVRE